MQACFEWHALRSIGTVSSIGEDSATGRPGELWRSANDVRDAARQHSTPPTTDETAFRYSRIRGWQQSYGVAPERWWRDRSSGAAPYRRPATGRAAAEANGRSCSTACGIRRQNEWDIGSGSTRALTRRGHEVAVESARERCEGRHVCGSVSIEARKRAPPSRGRPQSVAARRSGRVRRRTGRRDP